MDSPAKTSLTGVNFVECFGLTKLWISGDVSQRNKTFLRQHSRTEPIVKPRRHKQ